MTERFSLRRNLLWLPCLKGQLTISIVIFLWLVSLGQQQYKFTFYNQEQGLPSGTIRGIYKDTTGYLWLTSEAGVSRFDGYNFKVFRHDPNNNNSLPNNWAWTADFPSFGDIYFLIEDSYNVLFRPGSESFSNPMPFGDTIKEFKVISTAADKDQYWILNSFAIFNITQTGCTRYALPYPVNVREWKAVTGPDNSILLYKDIDKQPGCIWFNHQSKKLTAVNIQHHGKTQDTTAIVDVVFMQNQFYLISRKSVFRFDPESKKFLWQTDLQLSGDPYNFFPPALPIDNEQVMVRTSTGYLQILNINTGKEKLVYLNRRIPENELNDKMIQPMVPDHQGGVWMGSTEMGLFHYNVATGEVHQFIHEPENSNSLPGNFTEHLLADDNGILWATCSGRGLVKLEPLIPLFETAYPYVTQNQTGSSRGFSSNIRGFLEMDDGFWIATLNGLFSYSNRTHQFTNVQNRLPSRPFYNNTSGMAYPFGSMARDHQGNIWIGSWYGDLYVINSNLNRSYTVPITEAIRARNRIGAFRNLFCDSKNRMWVSTYDGGIWMVDCNVFDPSKKDDTSIVNYFFNEKDSTSLTAGIVFVVIEDADGQIWAGTEKGLCQFNEQTKNWKRYYHNPDDPKSLPDHNIRSLCIDRQGELWIGTNNGGLVRYNKTVDNFTQFTVQNGLVNDQIFSMVCDNNGMLWMGTNNGLSMFSPLNFSCKNFTEKDGIQNYEYNTGAVLKLTDGKLLFGGVAGYNIIDPDKIGNKKATPPVVVISSFKVFDKETPIRNHFITLSHKENNLSFEFAALSYLRNQENRYAYMLVGVDPGWVFSDTRKYVSYSQLKPGHYTFKVKASNWDGVWNENGTQFKFIISPPWWLTWWAYMIYLVITAAIIYIMLSFFKRRVLLQQQLKTEQDEAIRLKELDTFKSQLFTNLTHEFRTPLTVILGMAKQLTVGSW